jgi:hypothetical protein
MKTLLLTLTLTLSPMPVLACGDSYIVTPEGRCVNLTAEMQSPLRSVFSNGLAPKPHSVPSTPVQVQSPIPTAPRASTPKTKPVDPFAPKRPNNIGKPPEGLRQL